MGAQTQPFLALDEDLTWFLRATEIRMLNIVTSPDDRVLVLAQLRIAEGNAFNTSPFFLLEDAHAAAADGWLPRAERMRLAHDERRAAMGGGELAPPPLEALNLGHDGVSAFARVAAQLLTAYASRPPMAGVVTVLAPTRLEAPDRFAASVRALVNAAGLDALRFIVVDVGASSVAALVRELGDERAMATTCIVDRAELRREQERRIARAATAPAGAALALQAGFVGPRVAAPPRVGRPAAGALPPDVARALGPAAAFAGAMGAEIRRHVYAGAHALRIGNGDEAIRQQRAASDKCFDAGLEREGCILELALGAYLVHAGQRGPAREVYEQTAKRAEPFDKGLASRAYLGLGAVLLVAKEAHASAVAYGRAGELAREAGETLVALEAYRLAGQVALDADAARVAITMWQSALGLAEGIPGAVLAASSAPATARALAAVCEKQGLHAAAASLLEQAERFERGAGEPGPSE